MMLINANVGLFVTDLSYYDNVMGLENLSSPESLHVYFVASIDGEVISISAASKYFDTVLQTNKILHRLNFVKPEHRGGNVGRLMLQRKMEYFELNSWNDDELTIHYAYFPIITEQVDDFFTPAGWEISNVLSHKNQSYILFSTYWGEYKRLLAKE